MDPETAQKSRVGTMESYNSKMNDRPAFFEPAGTFRGEFTLRLWTERPVHYAAKLYEACAAGDLENAMDALRHGADPNVCDVEGRPLLQVALMKQNIHLMDALFQFGASLDAQDEEGLTALHLCAANPEFDKEAHWLLEMGADPKVRDKYERTAYHIALEQENAIVADAIELTARYSDD